MGPQVRFFFLIFFFLPRVAFYVFTNPIYKSNNCFWVASRFCEHHIIYSRNIKCVDHHRPDLWFEYLHSTKYSMLSREQQQYIINRDTHAVIIQICGGKPVFLMYTLGFINKTKYTEKRQKQFTWSTAVSVRAVSMFYLCALHTRSTTFFWLWAHWMRYLFFFLSLAWFSCNQIVRIAAAARAMCLEDAVLVCLMLFVFLELL